MKNETNYSVPGKSNPHNIPFLFPRLFVFGTTAVCFAAGAAAGLLINNIAGTTINVLETASLTALAAGFCGSFLYLLRKHP